MFLDFCKAFDLQITKLEQHKANEKFIKGLKLSNSLLKGYE